MRTPIQVRVYKKLRSTRSEYQSSISLIEVTCVNAVLYAHPLSHVSLSPTSFNLIYRQHDENTGWQVVHSRLWFDD
jgi:hypothetical protein